MLGPAKCILLLVRGSRPPLTSPRLAREPGPSRHWLPRSGMGTGRPLQENTRHAHFWHVVVCLCLAVSGLHSLALGPAGCPAAQIAGWPWRRDRPQDPQANGLNPNPTQPARFPSWKSWRHEKQGLGLGLTQEQVRTGYTTPGQAEAMQTEVRPRLSAFARLGRVRLGVLPLDFTCCCQLTSLMAAACLALVH